MKKGTIRFRNQRKEYRENDKSKKEKYKWCHGDEIAGHGSKTKSRRRLICIHFAIGEAVISFQGN